MAFNTTEIFNFHICLLKLIRLLCKQPHVRRELNSDIEPSYNDRSVFISVHGYVNLIA